MPTSILLVTVIVLLTGNELMQLSAGHTITRANEDSKVETSTLSSFHLADEEFDDESEESTTWSQPLNRFQRSVEGNVIISRSSLASRQCPVLSYHPGSEIGHQASCPFDWVVDIDPNRIPDKIIEQVCRRCRSCGPHRSCIQLRLRYDVFYRDSSEISRLEVRSGCVCMPQAVGSTAAPLDL